MAFNSSPGPDYETNEGISEKLAQSHTFLIKLINKSTGLDFIGPTGDTDRKSKYGNLDSRRKINFSYKSYIKRKHFLNRDELLKSYTCLFTLCSTSSLHLQVCSSELNVPPK